jgi:hypothetical protein
VVVGAVVVVVGAVVAVVPVVPDDPFVAVVLEVVDEEVDVADEFAWVAIAVVVADAPGISVDTIPPRTAADSAAPPVAITVMRLTLRRALALVIGRRGLWFEYDILLSFSFESLGGGVGGAFMR